MKHNNSYITDFLASKRERQRGSIAILGTLTLPALFGMLGLTFDAAYLYHLRRNAQMAADAGAKAGSIEMQNGSNNDTITDQVKAEAATNGFTDGTNGITVTVNKPPVGGGWAGNANAVQVIIKQAVPTSFMQVLGLSNAQVVAESVGGMQSGTNCVYALNPAKDGAITVSGGTSNVQANCGVVVDSSTSHAFSVSGGATFSATSVSVVGGVQDTSGADFCGSNCTVTNAPNKPITGAASELDPLRNIAEPSSTGACTYTDLGTLTGGTAVSVTPPIAGNGTLSTPFILWPGTYCNGFQLSAAFATFNPGTYIIKGTTGSNKGLAISGTSNVTGTGVTFFLTATSGSYYKQVAVSGSSITNFSAPTSGSLAGMLFFQDRTLTGVNNTTQESFTGGSNLTLQGALYFPLDNVTFSGGTTAHPDYLIIVADTITFSGGSSINNDYSGLDLGSPIQVSGIIE
jgi:Flp pilus assembly protein TadG